MIKFSIIVPVYNMENFLDECIKSILAQTYKNFELILVNDGSKDKSYDICLKYKSIDSRVRVINQVNGGVSKARNKGISIANGEYIVFIDGDDDIEENSLEKIKINIEKYNSDMVLYGLSFDIYENEELVKCTGRVLNKEVKLCGREIFKKFLLLYNSTEFSSACNKCYKMEIIKSKNIFFDEEMTSYEDLYFNLKFIENCECVTNIPYILYNYRCISGTNYIEKRKYSDLIRTTQLILDQLDQILQDKNCKEFINLTIQLHEFSIKSYLKYYNKKNIISGGKLIRDISNSKWFYYFLLNVKKVSFVYLFFSLLIKFKLYSIAYIFIKKIKK